MVGNVGILKEILLASFRAGLKNRTENSVNVSLLSDEIQRGHNQGFSSTIIL
jgi:hypothetical protein